MASRSERRHPRENVIRIPTVDELAIKKAGEYIACTAKMVKKCYFEAMRSNGISEVRTNKITAAMEELIKVEADK